MKFIKELYVSNTVKNVKTVMWKLQRNIGQLGIFLVVISRHPSDQLEIYHCSVLKQKYFQKQKEFTIVAITTSYDEAVSFVRCALEDCWKEQGDCQVKKYLLSDSYKGILIDRG